MAIDERQRHRLHERLDEVLGADVTGGISGLRAEFHQELSGIRDDMMSNQRQTIFAIVASQFTAVSLALAAFSMAQ